MEFVETWRGEAVLPYVYASISHMKRTTIYLETELELQLKLETLRRKQPMAELIREALRSYLSGAPATAPPGAGAFKSGRKDTADRVDVHLAKLRFGAGR